MMGVMRMASRICNNRWLSTQKLATHAVYTIAPQHLTPA